MKRLTVNIYRYCKRMAIGIALAFYPGYVLYRQLFSPQTAPPAQGWALAGMGVLCLVGVLMSLFGLLSLFVNRAVFEPEQLRYKTLFKNYTIPYRDVLHVTEHRDTVQQIRTLFRTSKSVYRVTTKSKTYQLSSFEFFGLGKEIYRLKGMATQHDD